MGATPGERLKKELGLFDVYAICTGAMFSSGFFLLPGLAAAQTGPSVWLAYLIAGILMLPAMFSMAELSTAMPKAGGDYYFLDRGLGPVIGMVGGLGTYLALSLKSAFALIGMGAYLMLFVDLPIKPTAVVLTVMFMLLNIFGAKETSALQRILVTVLVAVMALFVVQGIVVVTSGDTAGKLGERFTNPFMLNGLEGLLGTVGFVFVSYAGLTKIASVSEEVKNPQRNIPLGMMLSIVSTTIIYVIGIMIMVAVLPPEDLRRDLTPVATAGREVMIWIPTTLGLVLIVAAAVSAFASTGNAGIMAASRYPLAMGRDKLLPPIFARLGRFQTPTTSVLLTGALMIFSILALSEGGIAKLASAFQLLIFMLVNFTVIVMRQSRIEYYDPAYRSPLYPWMQIAGIIASVVLISYLGHLAIALTIGVAVLALVWYYYYAHKQVARQGAIYHWFEQLGRQRYAGLEDELRDILREQDLRVGDQLEDVIARAPVVDIESASSMDELAAHAVKALSSTRALDPAVYQEKFMNELSSSYRLVKDGVALPHLRLDDCDRSDLVMIRCREGIQLPPAEGDQYGDGDDPVIYAFFFLISPAENPGQHLRMLAHLARQINTPSFLQQWRQAGDAQELKEIMLHSEGMLVLFVRPGTKTEPLLGKQLKDLDLPKDCLIAMIHRKDRIVVPRGETALREEDRVTLIGSRDTIEELYRTYVQ